MGVEREEEIEAVVFSKAFVRQLPQRKNFLCSYFEQQRCFFSEAKENPCIQN
jgi:hypothetical protein